MLVVRLPEALELQLTQLAEQTGHSKSYYVKRAIVNFLEDYSDYCLAIARIEENLSPVDLQDVKKKLGLDE